MLRARDDAGCFQSPRRPPRTLRGSRAPLRRSPGSRGGGTVPRRTPQVRGAWRTRPCPPTVTHRGHVWGPDVLPGQQGHPASPRRRPAPRGGSSWGRRRLRAVLPPARGRSPRAGAWAAGRAPAVPGPEGGWAARPAGVLTPSDPGRDGELCLFRLFLKLTARIRLIYLRCTSRPRIYFTMFLRVTRSRPPPPCLPRPGARPPSLRAALPSKDTGRGGRQAWRGCPAAPLAAGVVPRCQGVGRAPGGPVSSGQGLFTGRGPSQGADSGPAGVTATCRAPLRADGSGPTCASWHSPGGLFCRGKDRHPESPRLAHEPASEPGSSAGHSEGGAGSRDMLPTLRAGARRAGQVSPGRQRHMMRPGRRPRPPAWWRRFRRGPAR